MTITVTQLNNYIHGLVDIDGVLSNVSVRGEITNLKKSFNGWYFSLKDEQASINCFCYEGSVQPQTGDVVIAEGQINYFVRAGTISLFVRRLNSTSATGDAYLRFAELKERLKREGLFDEERKKIVPHCCNKVGIVTSETGAVIHDIETVALRRQPFVNLILYPVKVQGEGAVEEIVRGLNYFADTDVDAIIVGRGGGSNEDLSVFNDEAVVRAVASNPKPVVSAVGHGVDFTLCDFASDMRAVTPSEAAEMVTLDVSFVKSQVRSILSKMDDIVNSRAQSYNDKVSYLIKDVMRGTEYAFNQARDKICRLAENCEHRVTLDADALEQQLNVGISRLRALNPLNVLQRGYACVSNGSATVKSVNDVDVGDRLTLTLVDGKISAKVSAKENK